MPKQFHSFTLQSGQVVKGTVFNIAQLSARFQQWAIRNHGMDDKMSLACWIANQPNKHKLYFSGSAEVEAIAKRGFEKIKGLDIPDFTKWE